MENKKDIGQAVRTKLEELHKQPAPAVWESIRADLDNQKKPRHFPLWLRAVTIIGVFAVFVTLGYVFGLIPNQDNLPHVPGQNVEQGNFDSDKNDDWVDTIAHSGHETESKTSKNENGVRHNNVSEANGNANPDETSASNKKSIHLKSKHDKANTIAGKDGSSSNSTSKDDANGNKKTSGSRKILNVNKSRKIVNNRLSKAVRNNNSSTNFQQGIAGYKNIDVNPNAIKKNSANASKNTSTTETTEKDIPKVELASGSNNDSEKLTTQNNNATSITNNENIEPSTIDSIGIAVVGDSLKKTDNNLNNENKKDTTANDSRKQFYAFAYAAPTAFKFPSGKSLLDANLNGKKTSSKITFNYGAFLGYKVTKRLELRAGIAITRIEQETSGIATDTTGSILTPYTGIKYASGVSNETLSNRFDAQPFTMNQKTQFTEIPLEVTYHLTGEQWGIKAIAGLSIVHIAKNEVTAKSNGISLFVGSIKNTANISFSAGAGAGFFYKITPALQLNAEPLIRYYANTFNDASPISFSLHIGLQYNFNLPKKKK